jgi:hypothetical protein
LRQRGGARRSLEELIAAATLDSAAVNRFSGRNAPMLNRMLVVLARKLLAMRASHVWLALGAMLALAITASALSARSKAVSSTEATPTDSSTGPTPLVGRIWIDRLPQKDTEHFEAFVAIDEGAMGVFQRASTYEGAYEVFKWEPRGDDKLQMLFPQTKKKYDVKYTAKTCSEGGYDYCLTLSGAPRGVSKYFSKKGWEIDGKNAAELERALDDWKAHLETARD